MRVLIACPKGMRTGGPEALHQLGHELMNQGVQVILHDFSLVGRLRKEVADYQEYEPVWSNRVDPKSFDLVIVPESFPYVSKSISKWIMTKSAIWWLSVDNADYKEEISRYRGTLPAVLGTWPSFFDPNKTKPIVRAAKTLQKFEKRFRLVKLDPKKVIHFAQSQYAEDFISRAFGKNAFFLSDYIPRRVSETADIATSERTQARVQISYNPAKGGKLVQYLSDILPDVLFVPIQGMSSERVVAALAQSHFYMDLGHFPGKDRLPREAVLAGTPVILAKRGAASFHRDFPIPEEYLLDLAKVSPVQAAAQLQELLSHDKKTHLEKQSQFKDDCTKDRDIFRAEVAQLITLVGGMHE